MENCIKTNTHMQSIREGANFFKEDMSPIKGGGLIPLSLKKSLSTGSKEIFTLEERKKNIYFSSLG